MQDWDDAFANMAHIPGSDALPEIWSTEAARYRDSHRVETDLEYGPSERHRFDLVLPDAPPKGLVVFVHGGFWVRLSKDYWTQFAEGCRAAGWAVALPSYTLAPFARIAGITAEIGQAITAAAGRIDGPIHLVGHSAGGHLVSRMVCESSPLPEAVQLRIKHVVSVSGVHDLRPLIWTKMNTDQRIDEAEALSESPALLRPRQDTRITAWVGGAERPEFLRQTRLLALMWQGLGARIAAVEEGHHNHFTVLDGLRDPKSDLTRCLLM